MRDQMLLARSDPDSPDCYRDREESGRVFPIPIGIRIIGRNYTLDIVPYERNAGL